ncbi:MAG: hypothetical protein ACRDGT_07130 [Candidatus Limnocylindria bacterium]
MAVQSYLPEVAGGMVVGGVFDDDATVAAALELLRASGVRAQDISVLARSNARAERLAGARAWTPSRNASGPPVLRRLMPGGGLPREVKRRFSEPLRRDKLVVLVAADGQPADTLAALLEQAKAARIQQWWQSPAALFAPPELAGPF